MNLEQKRSCKALIASIAVAIIFVTGAISKAEDGYRLWLRYDPLPKRTIDKLDISQKPRLQLRVLDDWDNLDGSIERGYAGRSLWDWKALPENVDPRLLDYARANASLGINGSVVNSVNANSLFLSAEY